MIREKFRDTIRFRFLAITCIFLLVAIMLLSTFIWIGKDRLLKNSLLANGKNLASYIALQSVNPIVLRDYPQLDSLVNDSHKDEIAYAVISDDYGNILTSQFACLNYQSSRFNAMISRLPRESGIRDIIEAIKKQDHIIEISVPVMIDIKQVGTVTIGLSDYRIRAQALTTILYTAALNVAMAAVLGFVLVAVSKKMILDPIGELTRATSSLSKGDLSARVHVNTAGEVKVLADRFNQMLDNLEKVVVSRDYVDAIIKSMIDTLIILSPDNTVDMANAAALDLLGYTEKELLGKPIGTVWDNSPGILGIIDEIRSKGYVRNIEATCITRDGVRIPMLLSGSVMSLHDRKPFIVCVAKDITERKRSEEEKGRLMSQLVQAQKMESIGQLAGGIAHDFNNMLTAVIGHCNLAQLDMDENNPARKDLDQILAVSERAARLTQSLLAFSRKQVISRKHIDLNQVVWGLNKFLARVIGEKTELVLSLASVPLTIFADCTQIEQILMNLASNARDAMPNGGKVVLETGVAELQESPGREPGFEAGGAFVVITVKDTGCGMDDRTKEKIFDPFFTTKGIGKGTGLGLSIVYGIVKQNNGYITVDTRPGRGTTFKIYLPLAPGPVTEAEISAAAEPLRQGKETILLAEDNHSVRELTKKVLSRYGYTVIEAVDGEEAVRIYDQNRHIIDLLLVDVIMPKKDGKEVYETARRTNPEIKVIFTSGYPADLFQSEELLQRFHFLPKPSPPADLLRKVREVLDS